MGKRWNLDRKPTAIERGIGLCGAFLLCVAGMAGLWFSVFVKGSLIASLATGAFTVLSGLFVLRFIFTSGRKLQRSEIIATAAVFTVVGIGMLVGSFFTGSSKERFILLFLGASGVGGGMLNLTSAKKERQQSARAHGSERPQLICKDE